MLKWLWQRSENVEEMCEIREKKDEGLECYVNRKLWCGIVGGKYVELVRNWTLKW